MRAEILERKTPRDLVETLLLEQFSPNLRPKQRIADTNLHPSQNIFSKSTNFPRGLIYKSKGAIFGIDISFRPNNPVLPCVRIVAPRGDRWREAVDHFASRLLELRPEAELFVERSHYHVTYS